MFTTLQRSVARADPDDHDENLVAQTSWTGPGVLHAEHRRSTFASICCVESSSGSEAGAGVIHTDWLSKVGLVCSVIYIYTLPNRYLHHVWKTSERLRQLASRAF